MVQHHEPSRGEPDASALLARHELRRRASAGVLIVGSRGLVIAVVGFVGQVVLARLLTPADFGAVAVGLTFVVFINLFADGGIGASLIRRLKPPERGELEALSALQVSVAVALSLIVAALAPLFGRTGLVTAVVVASTPLLALQIPGRIVLERALEYRRLAAVEVAQVLVFNAWAIGWTLAGAGVWGVASATVVRSAVGVLAMAIATPAGRIWPHFSWRRTRPLIGFGLRFQAVTGLWLLREQGLNGAVAVVSGVSTLGLVSVARRLLEVPNLLLQSLQRVSFPAMSQLVARREGSAAQLERVVGLTVVAQGIILTGLAGSAAGLVPGLFGEQWRSAASVLPAACLGLGISGAISIGSQAYLFAVGDAKTVLLSGMLQVIALFSITVPLLPLVGVRAVGLGWLASSAVEAATLGTAIARRTGAHIGRCIAVPTAVGLLSGASGAAITAVLGSDLLAGVLGGLASAVLFIVLLLLTRRQLLVESVRFARLAVRAALRAPVYDAPQKEAGGRSGEELNG